MTDNDNLNTRHAKLSEGANMLRETILPFPEPGLDTSSCVERTGFTRVMALGAAVSYIAPGRRTRTLIPTAAVWISPRPAGTFSTP